MLLILNIKGWFGSNLRRGLAEAVAVVKTFVLVSGEELVYRKPRFILVLVRS